MTSAGDRERAPEYRYGAVFACAAAALVVLVIAPTNDLGRAIALALESLALSIAVATSRERPSVRRARAVIVAVGAVLVVGGVAAGVVSPEGASALSALAGISASLALVGGS